jgi:hypothetical protein
MKMSVKELIVDEHVSFRLISDGLYYCEDKELMKRLPRRLADGQEFISYQQLDQDRPKYK